MTEMRKQAEIQATTDSRGSWASLLNPLSPLTGGVDRYPEFVSKWFDSTDSGQTKAWLLSKGVAALLLGAAVGGTAQAAKYIKRSLTGDDNDNPAYKMNEQISTTLAPDFSRMSKKAGSEVARSDWYSPVNIAAVGLPLAALLYGASKGWSTVGDSVNDIEAAELDDSVEDKHRKLWNLIKVRARVAKGIASPQEVKKALRDVDSDERYVQKVASLDKSAEFDLKKFLEGLGRGGVTIGGLALLSLAGLSTYASYNYFRSRDPKNAKYDAIKKGLREYTKAKTLNTPITFAPENSEVFFDSFDRADGQGQGKTENVRKLPEKQPAKRGISVSLD